MKAYELGKQAQEVRGPKPTILRPLVSTIGRLNQLIDEYHYRKAIGKRMAGLEWQEPTQADVRKTLMRFAKQNPTLKDVAVEIGSPYVLKGLQRIWGRKDYGLGEKLLHTLAYPMEQVPLGWHRANLYDPRTQTVTLYSGAPGTLEHELGHHLDLVKRMRAIDRTKPTSLKGKLLRHIHAIELAATVNALRMAEKKRRMDIIRTLQPALASYGLKVNLKPGLTPAGAKRLQTRVEKQIMKNLRSKDQRKRRAEEQWIWGQKQRS